jgi:hypothetical protein
MTGKDVSLLLIMDSKITILELAKRIIRGLSPEGSMSIYNK